jgi:hypothetical protein
MGRKKSFNNQITNRIVGIRNIKVNQITDGVNMKESTIIIKAMVFAQE